MASGVRRGAGRTSGKRAAFSPAMRPSSAASCRIGRSSPASPAMKIGALPHCIVVRSNTRHAARVERERRALEAEAADVRRASRWRRARSRRSPCARAPSRAAIAHATRSPSRSTPRTSAFGIERELALERAPRVRPDRRVAEGPHVAAAGRTATTSHAEPMRAPGPSSRPITPGPKTATERGRSSQSKTSSLTMRRSPAARSSGGTAGEEPVAITARRERDARVAVDVERPVVDEARVAARSGPPPGCASTPSSTKPTKRSRSRFTRAITALPSTSTGPSRRRPNSGHRATPCAASAAAISSLLGMQPTRAQVVPYGAALDQDGAPPRGDRGAIRGEAGGAGADDGHIHGEFRRSLVVLGRCRVACRRITRAAGLGGCRRADAAWLTPPCAPSVRALRARRCAGR